MAASCCPRTTRSSPPTSCSSRPMAASPSTRRSASASARTTRSTGSPRGTPDRDDARAPHCAARLERERFRSTRDSRKVATEAKKI
eukprot:7553338-Prorocentrum_lima.AAC.1